MSMSRKDETDAAAGPPTVVVDFKRAQRAASQLNAKCVHLGALVTAFEELTPYGPVKSAAARKSKRRVRMVAQLRDIRRALAAAVAVDHDDSVPTERRWQWLQATLLPRLLKAGKTPTTTGADYAAQQKIALDYKTALLGCGVDDAAADAADRAADTAFGASFYAVVHHVLDDETMLDTATSL